MRAGRLRRGFGCGVAALALGLTLLPAGSAPAMPLLKALLGSPPDSSQAPGQTGPWLPRVNASAALDRGTLTPEEIVARRLGGDVALTGADFVFRSFDLNGAGRGRTPWVMDGHALETSIIHWDNPLTVPLRALETLRLSFAGESAEDPGVRAAASGDWVRTALKAAADTVVVVEAGEDSVGVGSVGAGVGGAGGADSTGGGGGGARVVHSLDSASGLRPSAVLPSAVLDLFIPPGGGGSLLTLTTAPGPARPVSTVSFTGGDYGSRLGSFNFRRRFGSTAVSLDGVSTKQDGWAEIGKNRRDQGFVRFDFPIGAGLMTVSAGGGSGDVDFLTGGTEESKASRLAVDSNHRLGKGVLRLSFLRTTSGLKLTGSAPELFDLGVNQLRLGAAWGPESGAAGWTLASALGVESHHGLADGGDTHFNSLEAMARWRHGLGGGWHASARLVARERELTGLALEPGLDLSRRFGDTRLTLTGARSTGIPGIQLHTDTARPDPASLTAQLNRILTLEEAESQWTIGGGLAAGRPDGGSRLAGTLFAGAVRSDHDAGAWVPPLALVPGSPWFAPAEGFWTPRVDAGLDWRPAAGLEIGALGQFRGLDLDRRPGQSRVRGEAWLTLRRIYFAPELELAATLGGRYLGPRHSGRGDIYPGVLQGDFSLTATIRTLTLFWRLENLSSEFIESDLYDESGLPVQVPGVHARIGATLHLMD